MARTYRLIIGDADAGLRLDRYLVERLPKSLSRVAIQRLIRQGAVSVNGQPAKAHRLLKPAEVVVAHCDQLPPAPRQAAEVLPEAIPLDIVYEDEQLLVVNKPPGLVTHPAVGHWTGTLVNALVWHLQSAISNQQSAVRLPRAGIVHRLDKDTSGLLVVAKTDAALRHLAKQLKDRTLGRRYLAVVLGHVAFNEGTIDASIGRHATDRKLMTVRHLGGRPAVSHYRVLARRAVPFPHSVLEVRLETGRTHQIRVHVAHAGHPVLGDVVYSKRPAGFWSIHGITRQLLHAYAIRFMHPSRRVPIELTAPVPEDLSRWIPHEVLARATGGTKAS